MKFDEKKLKKELDKLEQAGWIEDFDINNIKDIEFTSPNENDVFNAFKLFKPEETRILIIGQDPYPDDDYKRVDVYGKRAHGLAFSFANSKDKIEPADDSLLNIFKAIKCYNKYETKPINEWNTNLTKWASKNKILLLNTALTYIQEEEHFKIWESFVTEVICNLIKNEPNNSNLAIFLWGEHAQNVFFQSINKLNENGLYDEEIENFKKNIKQVELNKRNKNKKIINKLKGTIRDNKVFDKIALYLTSHPSNLGVRKGFDRNAPEHFKACDEFLGEDIWKNFPEENQ